MVNIFHRPPDKSSFCYFSTKIYVVGTVNVLKLRTLKNNYFSAVRNFRNYVFGKNASVRNFRMWTLSGEKRYICMSKRGRNMLKTRRYDYALSTDFFFSLILLKPPLNSCRLSQ